MTKRSLTVAGHRTSVSLEDAFWKALTDIASESDLSVPLLVAEIDKDRSPGFNLSAAIRVYVLDWYRNKADLLGRHER